MQQFAVSNDAETRVQPLHLTSLFKSVGLQYELRLTDLYSTYRTELTSAAMPYLAVSACQPRRLRTEAHPAE